MNIELISKQDLTSKPDWVESRVVHFLSRNALQSILSSIFVVVLFSWFNRQEINVSMPMMLWSAGAIVLGCMRLLHYRLILEPSRRLSLRQWLISYRVMTLLSGSVYGLMPPLFFSGASELVQALIIFVIIGMPAAAAGTHVVDTWTYRLFSLSIVLPSIAFFMLASDGDHSVLGVLMILFWWVVDRSASRTRASLLENIELTFEMSYRATHDSMVGLLNREEIETQFELRAASSPYGVAMLFLDLDNFKPLNDTLGHQAGDDALVRVADIIRQSIRSEDLAARLGGDEFIIVMFLPSEAGVIRLSKSLQQQVRCLSFDDDYDGLSVSIGIGFHDTTDVGFSKLMRTADLALYDSKHAGKNQITLRHYSEY